MKETIYRCNECKKVLSSPTENIAVPHWHFRGGIYIARRPSPDGKWEDVPVLANEQQLCDECVKETFSRSIGETLTAAQKKVEEKTPF